MKILQVYGNKPVETVLRNLSNAKQKTDCRKKQNGYVPFRYIAIYFTLTVRMPNQSRYHCASALIGCPACGAR